LLLHNRIKKVPITGTDAYSISTDSLMAFATELVPRQRGATEWGTGPVLEVARDYGPKRKEAKADAADAEATVGHKVAQSALDVALKEEQLREARLKNERQCLRRRKQTLSTSCPVTARWIAR
jgi:hypothetical protein